MQLSFPSMPPASLPPGVAPPGADARAAALARLAHLAAPDPLVFPEEEEVPEGYVHLVLRTFLFQLLSFLLGPEHSVGCDQFVYWNAADPKRKLSPDVFVRLGAPQTTFGSWKTWEQGGVPDLAVEIVSPNEGDGVPWEEKLARYQELGVAELVRFDPEEPEGGRLRVWDRVRQVLVERVITAERTPCLALGYGWTVVPILAGPESVPALRLLDEEGRLLETSEERLMRERGTETARADAAEARVRELEEELRRRG
jgi:Uma2 family endonuclease